jgi:hypothetical protein
MTLDPVNYSCPEHHTDLTDLVTDEVDVALDSAAISYGGPFGRRRAAGPQRFAVIVTCPGTGGTGSHQVTCSGTWAK